MTLKEMYNEVARRVEEDIVIKDNQRISDSTQAILDKFLTSINYAYRKISLDKRLFLTKETAKLENNRISTDYLNEEFCEILKVTDTDGNKLKYYMEDGDEEILVDTQNTEVIVYYYYLPKRLEELSDEPKFPSDVDDMILCFFAAYDYLAQEGDEEQKAQNQLILYNDKYDSIRRRAGRTKYVVMQ